MRASVDEKAIVLLSTSTRTLGGIAAVIRSYERAGLFARWPVIHMATHRDGTTAQKFVLALRTFIRYVCLLLRGRVLLVHVHSASDASFWRKAAFIMTAFVANRPVIFHLHGGGFMEFYTHRCGPRRRAMVRFILDRSAEIIVLSEVWRRRISEITRNPNIQVIASPVEARDLLEIDRSNRSHDVLLFMGRLEPAKGIYDLIDAMAAIRRNHPALRLCLAGEGNREEFIRYARAREVDLVLDFTGWLTGAAKIRAWSRASVYVLPSYIEGLPMSILEAMAAGLPVVASKVGGIPDVVKDGVNGLLVSAGDVPGLAAALDRVLSDPALRTQFGDMGRQFFEEFFAPRHVIAQVEAAYRRWGAAPRLVPEQAGA